MKNPFSGGLTEDAFTKAENAMKIDKIGNGSYELELHGTSGRGARMSGKIQTPAQHAAVKRAAQASARKRRAGRF